MDKLEIIQVSKEINGNKILKDVNLEMVAGKIYGLVGHNGSGKTMLLRTIAGIMEPDMGKIIFNGKKLYQDIEVLPDVGITIDGVGLYPELTGKENLLQLARLKGKIGEKEVEKAIERVGLDKKDKRTYRKYSLGMKQRILIAQAIMEEPKVLLLDEPTNGLDDEGIMRIRKIIMEEKERGCLVILASHSKEDIAMLCNQVFHVAKGTVTKAGEEL